MIDIVETVSPVPRRELLAKAKELQAPRSFATGALAGLTLYLRGYKDDEEVLAMLREGIKFCDLCRRDLDAYGPKAKRRFVPEKEPRYYKPSEVVPSQPNIPELKKKVQSTKATLNGILAKKPVPEKRIRECHHLIEGLLEPYRRQAAESLGEFKYGPTLRE